MASRESFDLFTRWGRYNFFKGGIFGQKWSRHYVLKDTFGHHICAVIGHSKDTYKPDPRDLDFYPDEEKYELCLRCFKRVRPSTPKVIK